MDDVSFTAYCEGLVEILTARNSDKVKSEHFLHTNEIKVEHTKSQVMPFDEYC